MKRIALTVVIAFTAGTVDAEDVDPIATLQRLTEAVCAPIANVNTGSVIKQKFEVEAGANLRGVLKNLADAGLNGAAGVDSTEYVNGLASDALAGEIASQRDCNLRVYQDFSGPIQDWISADKAGVTVNATGNCNVIITGDGGTTTQTCTTGN